MISIKRINRILLTVLPAFAFFVTHASAATPFISLKGRVADPEIQQMPGGKTRLYAIVSECPFNGMILSGSANFKSKMIELKVGFNEPFTMMIPLLARRMYMILRYEDNLLGRKWVNDNNNVYILENGDDLRCVLSKNDIRFTGKGSARLNCQTDLHQAKFILKDRTTLFNAGQFSAIYSKQKKGIDSAIKVQKAVINRYRSRIGREMADILTANIYGLAYNSFLAGVRMTGSVEEYSAFLASELYNDIRNFKGPVLPQSILAAAPLYTDFLFERELTLTRLFDGMQLEANAEPRHIAAVYNRIKSGYSGVIRDKLLASFFLYWKTRPSITSFLEEGLSLAGQDRYRLVLINISEQLRVGADFFPFELEDTQGKLVRLSDLSEKLLIVDFWYTGCPGCANLKRAMAGVWQTYKDHPGVRFVSISIDKDREQWKRSVQTHEYTEPEAVNLYTGGAGKNHPVIKSLQIGAYPKMFIVKDGKVFSANPPWPSGPDTSTGTTREFIQLMQKGLQ
ncbi:TlpA family protein disulfide reductase [Pararcticibacter amylolyticus]|uniref:Thioredoxin domain-containing protein n=1 Tax=Pararcticibacter amylolyticus TaxID=2173175 RepID=A0A2U2PH23_9SPHI|nr:TlpA disulfide reductase family protein [Pararcticibacter amylolyticus]PWG80670.1 hypothetical protein DDR33_11665 [Pararcticibacter amylolyticus]